MPGITDGNNCYVRGFRWRKLEGGQLAGRLGVDTEDTGTRWFGVMKDDVPGNIARLRSLAIRDAVQFLEGGQT